MLTTQVRFRKLKTHSPTRLHSFQGQAVSLEFPQPPSILINWLQILGFPLPPQAQQFCRKIHRTQESSIFTIPVFLERTVKKKKGTQEEFWEGPRCKAFLSSARISLSAYHFLSETRNLTLAVSTQSFYCGFIPL